MPMPNPAASITFPSEVTLGLPVPILQRILRAARTELERAREDGAPDAFATPEKVALHECNVMLYHLSGS